MSDRRPDLNPYPPTSLAFDAWAATRQEFDARGRDAALRMAEIFNRNIAVDLRRHIAAWVGRFE